MIKSEYAKSRPYYIALRDIAEDIKKVYGNISGEEVWVVGVNMLFNKETRRLNAKLGLRSINRNASNMGRFKKK